jgi:hypothetical protein
VAGTDAGVRPESDSRRGRLVTTPAEMRAELLDAQAAGKTVGAVAMLVDLAPGSPERFMHELCNALTAAEGFAVTLVLSAEQGK